MTVTDTMRNEAHGESAIPYPMALVDLLSLRFGLAAGQKGAVICNGNDRLARLFERHGESVTVVDVKATETDGRRRVGTPDATGLDTASMDYVAADRILFYPNLLGVRREFSRILKPGAPAALVTDNRVYSGGRQAEDYEAVLREHCTGFREKTNAYDVKAAVARFFQGGEVYEDAFISEQILTFEMLRAQTLALPICTGPETALEAGLRKFFERWATEGAICVPTICRVAFGFVG